MPTVGRFDGITIYIYYSDHIPPHFHAKYGDYEATFLLNGDFHNGEMPKRQCKKIKKWATQNYDYLVEQWYIGKKER